MQRRPLGVQFRRFHASRFVQQNLRPLPILVLNIVAETVIPRQSFHYHVLREVIIDVRLHKPLEVVDLYFWLSLHKPLEVVDLGDVFVFCFFLGRSFVSQCWAWFWFWGECEVFLLTINCSRVTIFNLTPLNIHHFQSFPISSHLNHSTIRDQLLHNFKMTIKHSPLQRGHTWRTMEDMSWNKCHYCHDLQVHCTN